MLWSDSTHLTSFGHALLWPLYLYLGGLSKYTRAKPSSFAAHHLAYIPKVHFRLLQFYSQFDINFQLDDSLQDFYRLTFGEPASNPPKTGLDASCVAHPS
jgi:hypothetical protein